MFLFRKAHVAIARVTRRPHDFLRVTTGGTLRALYEEHYSAEFRVGCIVSPREAWRHRGGTIRVIPMPRARFTACTPHFYVLHFHVKPVYQTITQSCREIDHTNAPLPAIIPFLRAWVEQSRLDSVILGTAAFFIPVPDQ